MAMKSHIRVGNGCGFWGDNLDAPVLLARDGRLDYLTLEYLAELTMSILALQKERDPAAGYASDFLDVLARLVPLLVQQPKLKIVTNAGGMNPHACARKAAAILKQAGLGDRRVAVVGGDDLLPRLDDLIGAGHAFTNLDDGRPLKEVRHRVVSANAYLGARPIAEALGLGAAVVITGRVADASLTVAPAVHEFGWAWDDWERLAPWRDTSSSAAPRRAAASGATGGKRRTWPTSVIPLPRSRRAAASASPNPRAAAEVSTWKRCPNNSFTRLAIQPLISRQMSQPISRRSICTRSGRMSWQPATRAASRPQTATRFLSRIAMDSPQRECSPCSDLTLSPRPSTAVK